MLAFGLLSIPESSGQKANSNNHDINCQTGQTYLTSSFDNLLIELRDKDSLEKFKLNLDSIRKSFTFSYDEKFTLSDKWNLIYFQFSGWEHWEGIGQTSINHCYITTNKDTVFTSKQVFCEFNIGDSISIKQNPLKYFPTIYERDDALNSKWTAILPNSVYLIIRLVHSYPNGNATSWYKERTYYFKRAKN